MAVVYGSGTRFLDSDPLVMTTNDVQQVAARVPTIVVHLEAINHCFGTRAIPRADGSRSPVERVASAPASGFVMLSTRRGRRPPDAGVLVAFPSAGSGESRSGVIR